MAGQMIGKAHSVGSTNTMDQIGGLTARIATTQLQPLAPFRHQWGHLHPKELSASMVLGHLDLAWNNYSNGVTGVRTSTMRPMVVATRTLKFVQFRVEHLRFGSCHLHLQRISPIVWPVIMVMAIRPITEAMCFCHLGMNAFAHAKSHEGEI